MPNMANIVVKKSDGSTSYTLAALSSSPGDGGFAQWEGEGSARITKPSFRVKTAWNGAKTARRLEASGDFPLSATVNGVETIVSRVPFRFEVTVPTNVTTSFANDAIAVIHNFIAAQLIRDSASTGFSPT